MTSSLMRLGGAMLVSVLATAAVAQDSTAKVATMTDWSVFAEENPKECWGVSAPKETVNTKGGKPVSVRRGDILLFVTFKPGKPGEVSFSGGYPFETGSTVTLEVDGTAFNLVTEGEWAWTAGPEDDVKVLAAMKQGADAKLTGHSAKGTQTVDTFSLRGFTAAMEEAGKQCK